MDIRRSYDRLIFTMEFPILVRWHLYLNQGPESDLIYLSHILTQYLTDDIERVQIRAMRIIFLGLSYGDALVCSQLPTLKDRRNDICLRFFKSMEKSDHKLHHLFPNSRTSRYSLRKPRKYESVQTKTNRADGALVNWCLKHFSNSI